MMIYRAAFVAFFYLYSLPMSCMQPSTPDGQLSILKIQHERRQEKIKNLKIREARRLMSSPVKSFQSEVEFKRISPITVEAEQLLIKESK